MSKTDLSGGFTPILDSLADRYSLYTAATFGAVWRYCQMGRGVCFASLENIAERAHISRRQVIRELDRLVADGYLEDTSPDAANTPHIYRDTGLAGLRVVAFDNGTSKGTPEKSGDWESLQTPPAVTGSHSRSDWQTPEDTNKKENIKIGGADAPSYLSASAGAPKDQPDQRLEDKGGYAKPEGLPDKTFYVTITSGKDKTWRCEYCSELHSYTPKDWYGFAPCGVKTEISYENGDRVEPKRQNKHYKPETEAALYLRDRTKMLHPAYQWTEFLDAAQKAEWESTERKQGSGALKKYVDWVVDKATGKSSGKGGTIPVSRMVGSILIGLERHGAHVENANKDERLDTTNAYSRYKMIELMNMWRDYGVGHWALQQNPGDPIEFFTGLATVAPERFYEATQNDPAEWLAQEHLPYMER